MLCSSATVVVLQPPRGRLGCCVHLLQLWFCSHLSVIAGDQPEGFAIRNRVQAIVVLDLPFLGIPRVG